MGIKLVVAVTDGDWFDTLRRASPHAEVNFWSPSPKGFRALRPGELFLFKLHAPRNFIVGGGIFTYANELPCSLAWQAFGEANGAHSLQQMRERIARYRSVLSDDQTDFRIGCRILSQPIFFDESEWIAAPSDWSPNIVSLKTYDTEDQIGARLWEQIHERLIGTTAGAVEEKQARFGEPQLIRPRLGQGAFRIVITDNYERRCAVTGEKTLPALDAAHIQPYSDGGQHTEQNGLLLRRDIHSLFDAGYVTVTPDLTFEVSNRIREEFENGGHYYAHHGEKIRAPEVYEKRPDPAALDWHNVNRYKG